MVQQSTARYRFRKNFRVSADAAYAWLTDFRPDDLPLMGFVGTREVQRLTPDLYLLIDRFGTGARAVRKEKLVHLYPEDHSWISTYIGGPTNRSQFLYQIEPTGRARSRFTFTGLQMEYGARAKRGAELAKFARQVCDEDARTWTGIARAMHRALARPRPVRRR